MDFMKHASAFSPSAALAKTKKQHLATVSFASRVVVPVLPNNTTEPTRRNVAVYLMMAGTSDSTNLNEWKTYVAAYVCMMTPAFASGLSPSSFIKQEMSPAAITGLNNVMTRLSEALDREDTAAIAVAQEEVKGSSWILGIPKILSTCDLTRSYQEWVNKVILCHYSLVLFLAGKRLEGDDHTQINIARPKALRGKAHIEEECEFLEGSLKLNDSSHLMINNAWAEMSQLRNLVFSEYAFYSSGDADTAQDLIYTTMALLKFSNMAHAKIVFDFLRAYPWANDVPALKTSIGVYADSVRAASKMDETLFPYIKLIYGDKAAIFPRKELEPLVACAVNVGQLTQTSLSAFYVSNDFNPIVEAFLEEKTRRENIRDLTLRRQESELLDYEEDEQAEKAVEVSQV